MNSCETALWSPSMEWKLYPVPILVHAREPLSINLFIYNHCKNMSVPDFFEKKNLSNSQSSGEARKYAGISVAIGFLADKQ